MPTFLFLVGLFLVDRKMATAEHSALLDRITGFGELASSLAGVELVEVQLRGAGKARLLRIYIDKPGGVTHGDCELVSTELGRLIDGDESLLSEGYTLEVSSPGVERTLSKPRDFERVLGQKVKLRLRQPLANQVRFEGKLNQLSDGILQLEISPGELVHVPIEQVQKANLKFEW